ncbi:MAG: hypothetical protein V2A62_01615 [Candidatus Woesearchaeota archaeon]
MICRQSRLLRYLDPTERAELDNLEQLAESRERERGIAIRTSQLQSLQEITGEIIIQDWQEGKTIRPEQAFGHSGILLITKFPYDEYSPNSDGNPFYLFSVKNGITFTKEDAIFFDPPECNSCYGYHDAPSKRWEEHQEIKKRYSARFVSKVAGYPGYRIMPGGEKEPTTPLEFRLTNKILTDFIRNFHAVGEYVRYNQNKLISGYGFLSKEQVSILIEGEEK